ncbi:carboxypeptidase-like regulatory domain-containing protein [Effusibacillus consociatus]|uniref:Carboxypeptidase-like regulatory domain-containing protein n=1 Tax=Effusibacillus consociatus TaxID=1117041 RepID=A0ABV9Q0T4_9BACL
MKKLGITSLVAALLFGASTYSAVASSANPATQSQINGRITTQLVIPFAGLPAPTEQERKQLLSGGWVETSEGFVRTYPLSNATVSVDNQIVQTDANGNFVINNVSAGNQKVTIKHPRFNDMSVDVQVEKGKSAYLTASNKTNFLTFMEEPDSTKQKDKKVKKDGTVQPLYDPSDPYRGGYAGEQLIPDGDHNDAKYGNLSYVTCNRFNGYGGDQIYYNKWKHPWAAGVNMTQSDCDVGLGSYNAPCLNSTNGDYADDPNARYCKSWSLDVKSSATCSQLSSHRPLYHKHTGWYSPSGY